MARGVETSELATKKLAPLYPGPNFAHLTNADAIFATMRKDLSRSFYAERINECEAHVEYYGLLLLNFEFLSREYLRFHGTQIVVQYPDSMLNRDTLTEVMTSSTGAILKARQNMAFKAFKADKIAAEKEKAKSDVDVKMADLGSNAKPISKVIDQSTSKAVAKQLRKHKVLAKPKSEANKTATSKKSNPKSKAVHSAEKITREAKSKDKGKKFHISQPSTYPDSYLYANQETKLAFSLLNSTPLHIDILYRVGVVHNKSDSILSFENRKMLSFNSKFIVKPRPSLKLLHKSFEEFKRNVRLRGFWAARFDEITADEPNTPQGAPLFHVKSGWEPEPLDEYMENAMQIMEKSAERFALRYNFKSFSRNVSNKRWEEFVKFIEDPSIIIKPSDKNMGLTIVSTDWYQKEAGFQLNSSTYEISSVNKFNAIARRLDLLVSGAVESEIISERIGKYLQESARHFELPNFHLLPKVHKVPLKGRPIIPSHSWLTSNASRFLSHYLNALLADFPWIITTTKDYVTRIRAVQIQPYKPILVTGDITSMYTNIVTDTAISIIKHKILSTYGGPFDVKCSARTHLTSPCMTRGERIYVRNSYCVFSYYEVVCNYQSLLSFDFILFNADSNVS
ncbi:hypothetical protein V1525DRAFT_68284 [Lipomyces kononenkoae]|uniref:Uncharacterized protein n=1 Tax=Lipomyces kononenkoae TaxID=34357 RepID=A0ACC3T5H4_LIPKO